jgi:cytochrome b involved in lipid metabolism
MLIIYSLSMKVSRRLARSILDFGGELMSMNEMSKTTMTIIIIVSWFVLTVAFTAGLANVMAYKGAATSQTNTISGRTVELSNGPDAGQVEAQESVQQTSAKTHSLELKSAPPKTVIDIQAPVKPVPKASTSGTAVTSSSSPGLITKRELSKHNSASDCWLVVRDEVFDVTDFIDIHPGGDGIASFCGKDATAAFEGTHSSSSMAVLESYYIGDFAKSKNTPVQETTSTQTTTTNTSTNNTNTNTSTNTSVNTSSQSSSTVLSLSVVATHSVANNCWVVINNKVYDVTSYIPYHPGGPAAITGICGSDGTTVFNVAHNGGVLRVLTPYYVGDLNQQTPAVPPTADGSPSPGTGTNTPPILNTGDEGHGRDQEREDDESEEFEGGDD